MQIWTERLAAAVPLTALFAQVLNTSPAAPSSLCPGIDARLDALCLKALSKKPDERFHDVAEFVHALGGRAVPKVPPAFATAPAPAKPKESRVIVPTPPTVPLATIHRRGALRWTIRGGALAALGAAGVLAWRSLSGPATKGQLNGQAVRPESTATVAPGRRLRFILRDAGGARSRRP